MYVSQNDVERIFRDLALTAAIACWGDIYFEEVETKKVYVKDRRRQKCSEL